jgi:hypothetical protein
MVESLTQINKREDLLKFIQKLNISEKYKISDLIVSKLKKRNKIFDYEFDNATYNGVKSSIIHLYSTKLIKGKLNGNLYNNYMISIKFSREVQFSLGSFYLIYRKEATTKIKYIEEERVSIFKKIQVEKEKTEILDMEIYRFDFLNSDKKNIDEEEFNVFIDRMTNDNIDSNYIKAIKSIYEFVNDLILKYATELHNTKIEVKDKLTNIKLDETFVPDDILKLLRSNQDKIKNTDNNSIKDIVLLVSFLKSKKDKIDNYKFNYKKIDFDSKIKLEIYSLMVQSYNLILFHSFSMLSSIINDDIITFYEIRTMLDKISVFNSSFNNTVLDELKNVNINLESIIETIKSSEQSIINEIKNLNYVTVQGFENLSTQISKDLKEIDSSIKWNSFITTISTYQLYKINKNTKSLRN